MPRVPSDAAVYLGKKIKQRRLEMGLTQEALGNASDVGNSNVRSYENGNALPSLFTLIRIAKALDIPAGDLIIELEPDMFPEHKNRGQRLTRDTATTLRSSEAAPAAAPRKGSAARG